MRRGIVASFVHSRTFLRIDIIANVFAVLQAGTILNYNSRHALPRYLILSFTIYRPTLAPLVRSYFLPARAMNRRRESYEPARRRESTLTRSRVRLRPWEIVVARMADATCVDTPHPRKLKRSYVDYARGRVYFYALSNTWCWTILGILRCIVIVMIFYKKKQITNEYTRILR